jgi:hypothetical protein
VQTGFGTRARDPRGASIVEGAVGLVIIVFVSIGGLLLLTSIATSCYYKHKLGCVNDRAAEYLAALVFFDGAENPNFTGPSLQLRAKQLVDRLLFDYGMPASTSVTASISTSPSRQLLTVESRVAAPLLKGSSVFPASVSIVDTAVVPVPLSQPPAVVTLSLGGNTMKMPAYGKAASASFFNWTGTPFRATMTMPPGGTFGETP